MTIQIHDTFSGTTGTPTVNGHTPDVSVPASSWILTTGSGNATIDSNNNELRFWNDNVFPRINSGLTELKLTTIGDKSDRVGSNTINDRVIHLHRNNGESLTDAYEAFIDYHNDEVSIRKIVSSVITTLDGPNAFSLANNTAYNFEFSREGTTLVLKIDGSQVATASNSDVPSSTYVGVGTRTVDTNGRSSIPELLVETISTAGFEVFPDAVITNESTSWAGSNVDILTDVGDESNATYAFPATSGKELRLGFPTVSAPVGTDLAQVIINYSDPVGLPGIPLNAVAATQGGSETILNLSWSSVAGATGYRVYEVPPTVASDTLLIDVGATSYQVTGLSAWQTKHYKVAAWNSSGEGEKSVAFSGRTLDLTAPTGGSIASAEQQGTLVIFDINLATDNASGVAGYNLKNNGSQYDVITAGEIDEDTGDEIPPQTTISSTGATYSWTIEPFDAAGNVGTESAAFELVVLSTYPTYPQGYENDREPLEQVIWDRANGTPRGRVLHTKENYDLTVVHPYITESQRQALNDFWTQNIGTLVQVVLQDTGETHQCYMRKRPKFIPIAYDGTDHSFKAIVEFIQ